jgi:hypothetical protein
LHLRSLEPERADRHKLSLIYVPSARRLLINTLAMSCRLKKWQGGSGSRSIQYNFSIVLATGRYESVSFLSQLLINQELGIRTWR